MLIGHEYTKNNLAYPMNRDQAVFCQALYTPSKLLVVPARPTMPSSKLAYPRAVLGTVRSQRSESS